MSAKEPVLKLQTLIPAALHKRVKMAALMKDVEMKDFVVSALETACNAAKVPQPETRRSSKAA